MFSSLFLLFQHESCLKINENLNQIFQGVLRAAFWLVLCILSLTDQAAFAYVLYIFPPSWRTILMVQAIDINLFSPMIEHPSSKSVLAIVAFCLLRFWHNCCQAFLLGLVFPALSESEMKPLQIAPFHSDYINSFELTGPSGWGKSGMISWKVHECYLQIMYSFWESTLLLMPWTNLTMVIPLWKL